MKLPLLGLLVALSTVNAFQLPSLAMMGARCPSASSTAPPLRTVPLLPAAPHTAAASACTRRPAPVLHAAKGSASTLSAHPHPTTRLRKAALSLSLFVLLSVITFQASPALAAAASKVSGPASSPLSRALHFVLHLDKELAAIVTKYGRATYAILFAIVFAETGLVVTPFLPGDSLLFACGALCALGTLNLPLTCSIFLVAAILGDAVNYAVGNKLGPKAFESDTWFLKKKNLRKTEKFYETYGGKTIVLARFVPIVRTFAPFVAGVGSMKYSSFATYNVLGAVLWTVLFVGAGFVFGNIPAVQHNFTLVVLGIVVVSVLPVVWEIVQAKREDGDE